MFFVVHNISSYPVKLQCYRLSESNFTEGKWVTPLLVCHQYQNAMFFIVNLSVNRCNLHINSSVSSNLTLNLGPDF